MATSHVTIQSGSYQEVTANDTFLVQVVGNDHVYFAFDASAPAANFVGFVLGPGEALLRNGLTGTLYARAPGNNNAVQLVVAEG